MAKQPKTKQLSTRASNGNTRAGVVRYLPGFGTKYLLREDGKLYRKSPNGEYLEVAQSADGRVRLYHLGTESRRYLHVLREIVFPEATLNEILEVDREVPPGGTLDDLQRVPSDEVGEALAGMYADLEASDAAEVGQKHREHTERPESLPDDVFEL